MARLRLIGDVHGQLKPYAEIANGAEYSIQVGDVGFNYDYLVQRLDPRRHKIVGGNHDNYTEVADRFVFQTPHFLGDYGVHTVPDFGDIFYVRGGSSIDADVRTPGVDWWAKEQLGYQQLYEALEFYKRIEPDFVITHECPSSLIARLTNRSDRSFPPSRTAEALEQMLCHRKPKRWFCGHHHTNTVLQLGLTVFQCIAELAWVDFN